MDQLGKVSRQKPRADFEIRLVGHTMKPWGVPMRSLARALSAVQRLMEPVEQEAEDTDQQAELSQEPAPLHLIGVVARSAGYSVSACDPAHAIATIKETGRILERPDVAEWDPELLSPIEEISRIAKSLDCRIEFKLPGRNGAVLAMVTPDSYAALAETAFVTGESSVYGYLERVGGATDQRCGLRLASQANRMVYCTVQTEDLVRGLGQHMYENVLVSGVVTWFRQNWRVKHILVKGFEPSKSGSILHALDQIYEAGGKAWDEVEDPEAVIAEMRGK